MGTSADRRIEDLYAAELARFTEARNALARELADQGEDAAAERVKKLKKPTADAWGLNQLARERRSDVETLARVTEDLGSAPDAASARRLTQQRHELVANLVRATKDLLREAGYNAGPAVEQRVAATLYAATSDEDLATLRRGTWTRPLEGSGFEGGGFAFAPTAPGEPRADPRRDARDAARKRLREAEREAASLEKKAERARKSAEVAAAEAAIAQREVIRLRRRAERAEAALDT